MANGLPAVAKSPRALHRMAERINHLRALSGHRFLPDFCANGWHHASLGLASPGRIGYTPKGDNVKRIPSDEEPGKEWPKAGLRASAAPETRRADPKKQQSLRRACETRAGAALATVPHPPLWPEARRASVPSHESSTCHLSTSCIRHGSGKRSARPSQQMGVFSVLIVGRADPENSLTSALRQGGHSCALQ
jgi:hypothetical protein